MRKGENLARGNLKMRFKNRIPPYTILSAGFGINSEPKNGV